MPPFSLAIRWSTRAWPSMPLTVTALRSRSVLTSSTAWAGDAVKVRDAALVTVAAASAIKDFRTSASWEHPGRGVRHGTTPADPAVAGHPDVWPGT